MKIKNKTYLQLLLLVITVSFSSCEDIDENYKQYLEEGEILYTTKPDSIDAFHGNSRVKIIPYVTNAFSIDEFIVYWNNEENSQVFPFTKSNNEVDSPELLITGLEERTYQFDVYSRDPEGNRSVKKLVFATSYGENYRSNLVPRPLRSFVFDGVDGIVKFNPSDNLERGSEVFFKNTDGNDVLIDLPAGENEIILENLDTNALVSYRTFYVPTNFNEEKEMETSIDRFPSDNGFIELPSVLNDVLATTMVISAPEGVKVSWTNATNLNINVIAEFTVNGNVEVRRLDASSNTDGVFNVIGMESGIQDVKIVFENASGTGVGKVFTSVSPFPNLALNKSVSATEEAWGTAAANTVDGDLGNMLHTNESDGEETWFNLDLGAVYDLSQINIYNREDCCKERLSNYHIYISDVPIIGSTNPDIHAQAGVTDIHQTTEAERPTRIRDINRTGRYIRLQFHSTAGDHSLNLAEIEVY